MMWLALVQRGFVGWGIGCTLTLISAATHAMTKPNIIVMMTDDAGYNEYGFASAAVGVPAPGRTPNIDALAAQSTVLRQGYVSGPVCAPSRAALLTGQYAQRFGFEQNLTNGSGAGPFGLTPGKATIATQLKSLGYSTGIFGKWHQGTVQGVNTPNQFGFDYSYVFNGGDRSLFKMNSPPETVAIRRNGVNIENVWATEGNTSKYDPVNGRYLTDALAEETINFINTNADANTPFFAYVPFNAPHTPWGAKQSDLNQFPNLDPSRQMVAAMNYGIDRGVGDILAALDAKGIRENTIIVFTNDNGGPYFLDNNGQQLQTNSPFWGHKGSLREGGIRVPFLIDMPGVAPGIYNQPVTTVDLLPTFVAAAGGNLGAIDTDGVNLAPFLANNQPAHDTLFWRHDRRFAVRRGDWKIVTTDYSGNVQLFNIANDQSELNNLAGSNPTKLNELLRELTYWEATLDKPDWANNGQPVTTFDHFVFNNQLAASTNFTGNLAWRQGGIGTVNNVTLRPEDAYANGVFEFGTRDDASYTAVNDAQRQVRQTFMLNEMRLTGAFGGGANQTGTINGNPMLFTKNLSGNGPKIRLDATAIGGQKFGFTIDHQVQLLDDLEITGNGTQDFTIKGSIRDYFAARNVTKTGSSSVVLSGDNTFAGDLLIQQGTVRVNGASAALRNVDDLVVSAGASLAITSGSVTSNRLQFNAGAGFTFSGGRLTTNEVIGSLSLGGGTFAPGKSTQEVGISVNYNQSAISTLELTLAGGAETGLYDRLFVAGTVSMLGTLDVVLAPGFTPGVGSLFTVVTAPTILSNSLSLNASDDVVFDLLRVNGVSSDTLVLRYTGTSSGPVIRGDYNGDGTVDAADYTVWRENNGATGVPGIPGDGDNGSGTGVPDGVVNIADYNYWVARFGATSNSTPNNVVASTPVPEPGAMVVLVSLLTGAAVRRRYVA